MVRSEGSLSGAMNTLGSLGSFSSSVCFPWLLGLTGDIKVYFFVAALLNLAAAAGWWRLRAKAATGFTITAR